MEASPTLTPNTQAILLLTAPLLAGRDEGTSKLLTLGEYNKLARLLREKQREPADLIGPDAKTTIEMCAPAFSQARLADLLARGFLLSQAVDRWGSRAIWVRSRADANYPRRLKVRLKEEAPPILYGCGDAALIDQGGLAVVGSRQVDEDLLQYTEAVGRLSVKAHRTVISGGAKGIDKAAMHGALEAGGSVVGVLGDSLERAALARDSREALMDSRLVYLSPYDPSAGFNVGHAMQRNKLIYALADAALVVNSDFQKGGTWAGAIEQLERFRQVPVFVRNGMQMGKGNAALIKEGGIPWPNPQSADELEASIMAALETIAAEPTQKGLALTAQEDIAQYAQSTKVEVQPAAAETVMDPAPAEGKEQSAADELLDSIRRILGQRLRSYETEADIASLLNVSKAQAKQWIALLVADGTLEKSKKPVRYRAASNLERLF